MKLKILISGIYRYIEHIKMNATKTQKKCKLFMLFKLKNNGYKHPKRICAGI